MAVVAVVAPWVAAVRSVRHLFDFWKTAPSPTASPVVAMVATPGAGGNGGQRRQWHHSFGEGGDGVHHRWRWRECWVGQHRWWRRRRRIDHSGWLGTNHGDGSNGSHVWRQWRRQWLQQWSAPAAAAVPDLAVPFSPQAGTLTVRHCTFERQFKPSAAKPATRPGEPCPGEGRGGAIGTYAGTITLDNCILFSNVCLGIAHRRR